MCLLVLPFLLFNVLYINTECKSINTTVGFQSPMYSKNNENHMSHEPHGWKNVIPSQSKSFKVEDLKTAGNSGTPRRQSRFLGGLAFLAGLSVGGLATAASTSVKSFAKLPPASVTLNVGHSRFAPYLSAYYDPYSFPPQPYFYPNPFGFYPFLHPSKLQPQGPPAGIQSSLQPPATQNYVEPDIVNDFDNKRPVDIEDHEEEYIEETKKAGKEKPTTYVKEELADSAELQEEDLQHVEQKMTGHSITCTTGKHRQKKPNGHMRNTLQVQEVAEDLAQEADDSGGNSNVRAANKTTTTTTTTNTNQTMTAEATTISAQTNLTEPTTQNSTTMANNTDLPPFFGYYGGNPQPIDNVDFTTEQYPDYNPVYYGLPNDKPANFQPYELYPNSPQNSFSSGPYLVDAVPDYLNNGFDRIPYTPDNGPSYATGFRPNFFRSL